MRVTAYLLAGVLLLILIAACKSDSKDGSTPSPPPAAESPTSEPAVTVEPAAAETEEPAETPAGLSLPDTPIVATLTDTYKTGQADPPSADELPAAAGSVEARWYQSDGQYVVYYAGLSLADSGPICPGNSIATASGFEHISNAPTAEGACVGATTLATAPAGVKVCGEQVLYLTEIPVDLVGTLYGTVERFLEDGTIIGLTSTAEADAAAAPEIDLSSC